MLNEVESAEVSNGDEEAQMISVSEEPPITAGDEVIQALREGVRLLPPQAVKDLLSIGVCSRFLAVLRFNDLPFSFFFLFLFVFSSFSCVRACVIVEPHTSTLSLCLIDHNWKR